MRPRRAKAIAATAYTVALLIASLAGGACSASGDAQPAATPTEERATASEIPLPTSTASPLPPSAIPSTATPVPPPPLPSATPVTAPPPPPGGPATTIRRIGAAGIFLTFDAGAGRGEAAGILDILAANSIRASFGMTGKWAEQNPDLVRRMVGEGHTLINHSYSHPSFTGSSSSDTALTLDQRRYQINHAEDVISGITGATTKPYFRPPFGDYDAGVLEDAGAEGYRYSIMWQIDSGGWRNLSADEVLSRVSAAQAGDIVVFHVAAEADYQALPRIIDAFRGRGIGLVPLAAALQ